MLKNSLEILVYILMFTRDTEPIEYMYVCIYVCMCIYIGAGDCVCVFQNKANQGNQNKRFVIWNLFE